MTPCRNVVKFTKTYLMTDSPEDFSPFSIEEVKRKKECQNFKDHCDFVLNNFKFFIPGGNTPYPLPESIATVGYFFDLAIKRDLLHRECIHKHADPSVIQVIPVKNFFDELNEVLEQNNKIEVMRAVNPFYAKKAYMDQKDYFFLWKKLLPLYMEMRQRGFSQKLLWT